MKKNNLFKVDEGLSFIVTIGSENVNVLRKASEKYHVEIPDAKYIIICTDEEINYYFELDGGGITEFAFGIETDTPKDKTFALTILVNNLNRMDWDEILKDHLSYMGIEYEG